MTIKITKVPYCELALLKKINRFYLGKLNKIITWSRKSTILPRFIGLTIYVNNGKSNIAVLINENMIGHKLGEFSQTRKVGIKTNNNKIHKKDNKQINKR